MIINDEQATKRLNSPMNLINQLRNVTNPKKRDAMNLFGIGVRTVDIKTEQPKAEDDSVEVSFNNPFHKPSEVLATTAKEISSNDKPKLDDILENHDSQIKLGLAHDTALQLLTDSLTQLTAKLDDVKAEKLPSVIAAASKTVESIRKERNEQTRNGKDREVHYHFYTPTQNKITDYNVIDVT